MAEEFDLVPGGVYKRTDLHEKFGGQRQGGISTPTSAPIVLLFSNDSGELYGYKDGFQQDGTFLYTGEGQVGDMAFVRGNRALVDHRPDGRLLHLFEQADKPAHVRYLGEAEYLDHHETLGPDKNGDIRKVIVFVLGMVSTGRINDDGGFDVSKKLSKCNLAELRKAALANGGRRASFQERAVLVRYRSEAVKLYVRKRAGGICEACKQPAPFNTKKGLPYLEPHHITRLADGGPDHPAFVAAICPTCHRRIHHGADGDAINAELLVRIGQLEQ